MSGVATLSSLERPEGGFTMLALDQRVSLLDLLGEAGTEEGMREFKREAAAALSPIASAVLLDRIYGVGDERPRWLDPNCTLILAVDRFVQEPGRPVAETFLDEGVDAEFVRKVGAGALKFLVLWDQHGSLAARTDVVSRFLELSRASGVPSILEAIVRNGTEGWTSSEARDDAIVAAAAEFNALGPDLYKAEVPTYGRDLAETERRSAEITAVLDCPWVVLSNGVDADGFPAAVRAACAGGASGFLAGRAVWAQATAAADQNESLRTESVRKLELLTSMVPSRAL